jgi:hypothetical protein
MNENALRKRSAVFLYSDRPDEILSREGVGLIQKHFQDKQGTVDPRAVACVQAVDEFHETLFLAFCMQCNEFQFHILSSVDPIVA